MESDFEKLARSRLPEEALFIHFDVGAFTGEGIIELRDGRLLIVAEEHRLVSADGGETWSTYDPLLDEDGNPISFDYLENIDLIRLDSGQLGMVYEYHPKKKLINADLRGSSVWFRLSDDEGKTWSKPVRVSEPYNHIWFIHGAIVTSNNRIVVPVYSFIGGRDPVYSAIRDLSPAKGRALFGDNWVVVGHHDYESMLCYCLVYYSDDRGTSWLKNQGIMFDKLGGELMVNIDYTAGGHHSCEEPIVVEVSPDHLLMILRTPLGRLYQSWSKDDGKTWCTPEPTALASARVPASLARIPGTEDLLIIWNQASADEIQRGQQRIRLSSAISHDGGASWMHGKNIFESKDKDTICVEPPPIQCYRSMEHSPRVPPDNMSVHYPTTAFWKDRAIISFGCRKRTHYITIDDAKRSNILQKGVTTSICLGLPIAWFYD